MNSPLAPVLGIPLDLAQTRVLGSLMEKEITTPEQYPLSLNALINACNQRSSRDPVVDLTQRQVLEALDVLEDHALVTPVRDARVTKYEHRIRTVLNLRRDETALLCLLLLRGPQTPGELRARADRLYAFDDLAAVQSTLDRMARRSPAEPCQTDAKTAALVVQLPRQPGSREARSMHLLGEPPDASSMAGASAGAAPAVTRTLAGEPGRVEELESEIEALRQAMIALHEKVDGLVQRLAALEGEVG